MVYWFSVVFTGFLRCSFSLLTVFLVLRKWPSPGRGGRAVQGAVQARWKCHFTLQDPERPVHGAQPQDEDQVDQADLGLPEGGLCCSQMVSVFLEWELVQLGYFMFVVSGGCVCGHGLSQTQLREFPRTRPPKRLLPSRRLFGHHRPHPGGLWEIQMWSHRRAGGRNSGGVSWPWRYIV